MKSREKVKGMSNILLSPPENSCRTEKPSLENRFVFMEFKTTDDASYAMSAMDGHPFDAKHTFRINHFTDIERYADMDESFVEPEPEEYQPKVIS